MSIKPCRVISKILDRKNTQKCKHVDIFADKKGGKIRPHGNDRCNNKKLYKTK